MTKLVSRKNLLPVWTKDVFDLGNFFNSDLMDFNGKHFGDLTSKIPSVNIVENDKDFQIDLAAPGMDKSDFKVSVENGTLNISASKETDVNEEKKNYTRREYAYNSFSRSFHLPENCEANNIIAQYQNGILHLTLPKKEGESNSNLKEITVN